MSDHVKGVTLEPVAEVEVLGSLGVLGQALGEDVGALVDELFVVD
jgi:hypothetical protein